MNSLLDLFWLLFLLAVATWAVAAIVTPLIASPALHVALSPATRARRALLIAALPWIAPLTVVASVCLLAVAKPLGWIADHCLYHGPGHPHLCLEHLPAIGLNHVHALGAGLALLCVAVVLARFLAREHRMAARLNTLHALAHGRHRLHILEDDQSLAFAAGLGKSFVLLSRGLLRRLAPRERRIVLAHEVAHLRNGDLIRNLAFEVLLLLQLPWTARALRAAWRQALEERADDRVAARFGTDDVASTLLKVLRITLPDPATTFSAAGANPLRRVERLLSMNELSGRQWQFEFGYVVVLLGAAITVTAAHHALETLLGFLTGA